VEVSNTYGNDSLNDGFRYFPTGGAPFNCADVHTESLDTPATVSLITSGLPGNPFHLYYSYGGGPVNTSWGIMGLDLPIFFGFSMNLNAQGYWVIPVGFDPGFGGLDLYIHFLGTNSQGKPAWCSGGNNPNGSGSIWVHLNN
jgi:hypothetical protein